MLARISLLILLSLLSVACVSSGERKEINNEPGALDIILCEQPRPQICTREYDPVCATLEGGEVKTYATGCTSCADTKVTSYITGKC